MKHKLILAFGNPDRQDDGAGWYVLQNAAKQLGQIISSYNDDYYASLGNDPDFFFTLQLTPELSDLIKDYDEVCFIDASVGKTTQELEIQTLIPGYQFSPLSHHMSPQSLLDVTKSVTQRCPVSFLLTIPGVEFGFSDRLSNQAQKAADTAISWILDWVKNPD